jgi:tetratricopeptide (TPR) repeat protein
MKRTILTGVLAMAAGLSSLWAQPIAPKVKSQAEAKAIKAIQDAAADPDAVIKAAEELINKYSDSDFKEFALTMEAHAYQQKRDDVNAQLIAERVLEINPKAYSMQLVLGEVIAPGIKEHDLDRKEKVDKCTKLFTDAIANAAAAVKPNSQISDADWAGFQKSNVAEGHNGLGILALLDKNWDVAIKEFQAAVDNDPEQDAYATRLASSYYSAGKYTEAIALCDKLLAKPNLNPQIARVVNNIKAQSVRNQAATKK